MDRTLISWNVPNLITIPLMAMLGFLLIAAVWQAFKRVTGGKDDAPASNSGGY